MSDPLRERMDALTSANVRMLRRLEELERRLSELERGVGGSHAEPAPAVPAPEPPLFADIREPVREAASDFTPEPPPAPEPIAEPIFEPVPHEARRPSTIDTAEAAVGLNWVNRIGALTLIIGAAFFFKYAVDNEWIGPTGRILLGLLAGGLTCGFGFRSWSRGHSIFAQGVSAAGLALLYLSIWASYSLYHLAPAALAFAVMVAITLLSGAFAWRFESNAMAALGMVGGYFTPVLLSSGEYRPWFFSSYMFMLNAGWLYLARRRQWWKLELLAAGFTAFFGADFLKSIHVEDRGPVGTFCLVTQYAVFGSSPISWLVYIAQFIAGLGAGIAWEDDVWRAGGLSLAVLITGLAVADRRRLHPLPMVAWAGFTAGFVFLYDTYTRPIPMGSMLILATLAFLAAFGYTAIRVFGRRETPGRFELLLLVVPGLCYFLEGFELLKPPLDAWRGLFTAAIAVVYLATGWMLWERQPAADRDRRPVIFCAGSALALITVAIAVQFSGFRITMLWALEATALAWLGSRYDLPHLRIPVALLSVFVLFRLMAIDADAYRDPFALDLFANLRFLTCVVSAAALGCAAWLLRTHVLALVPYLTAHAALLFGLALENYSWVVRTAPAEHQVSAIAVGLGVLGAAYGLALVIAGVITRTRLNRLLGLGLLAVVVFKLYLLDVWTMDRLSRILAFSALGILLLATSFFYSRFRARIEAWIKDDQTADV